MTFPVWAWLILAAPLTTALLSALGAGRKSLVGAALLTPAVALWGLAGLLPPGAVANGLLPLLLLPAVAIGLCAVPRLPKAARLALGAFAAAFLLFAGFSHLFDSIVFPPLPAADRPGGFSLAFHIEPLSALFLALVAMLWPVALLYALDYLEKNDEPAQGRFLFFYALSVSCALGIALAANGFTLFLFYELLTLSTFPLVVHRGDAEARQAGRVYLGVLIGGSLCLFLPGLALVYIHAGTLDFVPGGLMRAASPSLTLTALALLTLGLAKAALMPLHRWLTAAMVAPAPVSALLHAVAVVKGGAFAVTKCAVYLFGTDAIATAVDSVFAGYHPLLYLAWATALSASGIALYQDNLKRLLAYSTIGQLAYIVMAALAGAPKAAGMQLMAHGFGKMTLFFAVGVFYSVRRTERVSETDGIAAAMPWTTAAFAVGALSMIGLPPAAGFTAKESLLSGAYAGGSAGAVAVLVAGTMLNAAYFLPILYRAYFLEPGCGRTRAPEPLSPMLFALLAAAFLTMLFFFMPEGAARLAAQLAGG
jgi:multicomponent Na+:H+ antiporter subunit D